MWENSGQAVKNLSSDTPLALALIGHKGRMGHMLLSRFQDAGFEVRGVDIPLKNAALQWACAPASVVLLCVPAAHIREVSELVCPHMQAGAVLSDITSVKMQPMDAMQRVWPGPVVGTHPLFGPHAQQDADQPVVLTPGQHATPEHCALLERVFKTVGCRVFTSTAALHDEAMAAVQGLNFISSVAYFATLAHKKDYLPFLTPSFRRRQAAAHKLLTEDAALFEGLFEANPFSQESVRQFRAFLNVAAGGDLSLLSERAKWWWEEAQMLSPVQPSPESAPRLPQGEEKKK